MINNIAHHLHASPIMHVHVVTLIMPIIITCSMHCIIMATLMVLLHQ